MNLPPAQGVPAPGEVVLLDAAMGTRLVARGLDLATDDPALWNLSRPASVSEVHQLDVAAGSLALFTNTFGANRPNLERFGLGDLVATINRTAVSLARSALGPDRWLVGSIGPLASRVAVSYREQGLALAQSGVNAIILETHSAEQAEIGLTELSRVIEIPLMVSLHEWGDRPKETARRLVDLGAQVLGVNCVLGMQSARVVIERLRTAVDLPLLAKPSAGLPGQPPTPPAAFAGELEWLFDLDVRFVGGCCGTTEVHIAALKNALADLHRSRLS
jgi:methionine synthase I (cobalamin-dependent)